MKLLVISGGPRSFGRSKIVANFIANKYGIELIDLSNSLIPLYDGTIEQNELDAVQLWREKVKAANGVLVISPEYHNGMSGVLKNALDFLGSDQFSNKPVSLVAVAGGGKGGINALNNMRIVLRGLYANVLPKQLVLDPDHFQMERKKVTDPAAQSIDELVKQVSLYVRAWEHVKAEEAVS
ncbi:NAD(P)H-dependent oxidoreductase [Anaerobacillus alkaliphilus]|uniref:NAD(P)H-dependent oxidoreductase n=1 Tax=Anaerobacillus alkaliphilus TaxID=1548597 RepID=A0A4Q0VT16_9BACI|nr:NADPH-dependent FMN reductase [Anaerobacillus alkaliphilus]RXJ00685.1 NAD(P)H-dependent oxidoreductase [Anaerobacillus alkaliphilus]